MKLRFILLAIMLHALIVSACGADGASANVIIVDFPRGTLRLRIRREGETHLFYAALPYHRTVQNNTFDIDDLFQELQPRVHNNAPSENRPSGQPYGTVTIEFGDGSEKDYLIYDETFAVELFQTACANLVQNEEIGVEIFNTQCTKVNIANIP